MRNSGDATIGEAAERRLASPFAELQRARSQKILSLIGVRVVGYVKQVGEIVAAIPDPSSVTLEQVESKSCAVQTRRLPSR